MRKLFFGGGTASWYSRLTIGLRSWRNLGKLNVGCICRKVNIGLVGGAFGGSGLSCAMDPEHAL